ncbi:MAG: RusA family crossover junction endodeoxyribonuclease [Stenotrophomonas sp.]|uniref:RusA family crossover junction endodeoxyribonuclease n=1 Tax=Stenotrophomonas sp. TaxID=69392 RepID=UPI0029AFBD78|nr:RusA family crossover junction endodeoxyribonuclease [Stenotrophomonas sp.]MDX3932673.1 RusA family crossover junction endodeoxyribonuclease [Stenotrophomonas sp.]
MSWRLVLPYPISANRYWRQAVIKGRAVIFPSKEAKAFKAEVAWKAKGAGIRTPLEGRVAVHIRLFPQRPQDWAKRSRLDPDGWADTVRCIDLGNAEKVLSDALNGVAWKDDKQIHRITLERCDPDGDARVEIEIAPLASARIAGDLFEQPKAA